MVDNVAVFCCLVVVVDNIQARTNKSQTRGPGSQVIYCLKSTLPPLPPPPPSAYPTEKGFDAKTIKSEPNDYNYRQRVYTLRRLIHKTN